MKIQSIRGMNDIHLPDIFLWQEIESLIRSTGTEFGYSEIRTPVVESTELFKRGVGTDTDIVEKEMYTFLDRNGESLTLRPEGTAGVVRAITEHALLNDNPTLKLYYLGVMFRHERPQKGRYRQFYQYGIEHLGPSDALADVEVMAVFDRLAKSLGLSEDIQLKINSVGCSTCRAVYREKLIKKLETIKDQLPEDVQKRMYTNPQRIFDHKAEAVQKLTTQLPLLKDDLCEACQLHHKNVEQGLEAIGVAYVNDPKIVRGLDYYTQTAFEFVTDKLGAQATVCGGGRYNKLVSDLGGPETPGVGFGMGMERLVLLLEQKKQAPAKATQVFFVYPDEKGKLPSFKLCNELRAQNISADIDLLGRSMKSQMKRADKLKAELVVILGGSELDKGSAVVRNMSKQTQSEVDLKQLVDTLVNTVK